ncbi:MAG: AmmeMemoRadiSam system protein B [Candidatus Omnitrophica bacterium]|nr:AmmeMemoRadiSam system protein B [Candidatus Omnitrophota bacterium]
MIRKPQVAGQFYPANASRLKQQLQKLLDRQEDKVAALGLVSPHAGYVFSGAVAAGCFSQVELTETVVILGPNHTGLGKPFSIMTEGIWQMPLGKVEVDTVLAKRILQGSKYLDSDTQAHAFEHSIEVQLPFLQFFLTRVKIVPIVLSTADLATYNEIGNAIAKALTETEHMSLIVASSDMSHYEPQQTAKTNDFLAIEAILKLDEEELLKRVKESNITMCGSGPIACMIHAVKKLGAKSGRLIKYMTSGDVTGDFSSVVGYAGIMIQ